MADKVDAEEIEVDSQPNNKPKSDLLNSRADKGESEEVKAKMDEKAREKDPKEDHTTIPPTHNSSEAEFVKKPGEFTTEVFKIEIRNLPRYVGYKVTNAELT